MPGNEVGDRVHNFFEQDSDREKSNQFSLGPYGLNFTQPSLRPEFVKNPSHQQQSNLNGFMHIPQAVHTKQNEANFLGVDAEPDRHTLTSRGLSVLESQHRSGSPHAHSARFGSSESPMNFNFLSGQQPMSGQQPGTLQSLPRQQFAFNDAQLLPQHVMLKQMQELQMQKQFQQSDTMQRHVVSQIPAFPNQMVGQHSLAVNGNPMYDASNYPWPSQPMAGNTHWSQRGPSLPMQGYSNGLMITPEQGQAMRFMGLTQQASQQSLYGVPVSSSHNVNSLSLSSTDRPGVPQVSAPSNPFSSNSQYAQLPEHVSMQDETIASRPGSDGKSSFVHGYSQGLVNVVGFGSFNQMQQTNAPISENGRHNSAADSEMLPEKSVNPNTTKQDSVALDPTEEKFLFGSDENIWDAFGSDVDRLDGPDLSNGLPLSGTWSALMQSAVAETTSTDVGMQEEWSGLGNQNTRSRSDNLQSSVCENNVKEQPIWVDRSQRYSLDLQTTPSNVNSSGLQKRLPNQPKQSLPTEKQILPEGRKWLDGNQLMPQTGKNWTIENANPSQDFAKTDIGFWNNQQRTFLQDNSDQSSGRPNVLNFIESVPANGSTTSANQDNLHDEDHNRHISMDANHSATLRSESISDYKVDRGNPHVHSADAASAPSLGNMINPQYNRDFPDNRNLDIWKSVTSSAQYGFECSGKQQYNLNKGPPILESSVTVPDGIAAEMHETGNGNAGGSSNDSHHSSFQHQAPAGRLREKVWSDVDDQRNLHVGKEKPSEQAGKRAPVTRKFQYHPMGDMDMDVDSCSHASKHPMRSQHIPQHFSSGVRGHETPARFLGQSGTEGCVFQGAPQISDRVGIQHSQYPNASTPFVNSSRVSSQHQKLSPSQNMLELLHKVDQSEEQASVSHISSTDGNGLSEIASGGSVRLSQSQLSTSHGFNLQLAPPSQAAAPSNLSIASQRLSPTVDSPSSGCDAFEKGEREHAWLVSVSSAQYSPSSHPPPQMGSGNDKCGISGSMDADVSHLKGNPSPLASGSSYLRSPLLHDHNVAAGEKMMADQSSLPFGRHSNLDNQINDSQDQTTARFVSNSLNSLASGRGMNQFGLRASMHQMPMSSLPGIPRNDNLSSSGAKMWFQQQQLMGPRARNTAELLQSQFQSNDTVSSQGIVGGEGPVVAEAQPTGKTGGGSEEEEPIVEHLSDASPTNSAANQKDSEAFHHSLKSNNTTQHSYSLLHQIHAVKSMGEDPSHHESKRLKGTDNSPVAQDLSRKVEHTFSGGLNNMVRDSSIGQTSISIGDARMLNISPQPVNRINSFQSAHGMCTSQETLDPSDPQKVVTGNFPTIAEHGGINPQMAPSWLQQYGTYKNGVHNVPRMPMVNNADQTFIGGKILNSVDGCDSMQLVNVTSGSGQIANDFRTTNVYPSEHFTSLDALVPRVCNPTSASIRPKKRKTATSDLMSWSKEIGLGCMRFQTMSSAEVDWAKSSNRLVEKVEEETDANEDILRASRPKRRLILTAQLMQQVFRSPSPAVLSVVASSNYEMIMYSLSRLTAGDACSLICCSESDSPVQLGSENLVSGKVKKSPETMRDQYFSEVIENFINRAKELESGLVRLDKRASILDFRLDLQDLDRFSVISRFARFHGRVQVDGAESSSSSSDPTAVIQRPCPQRYVSAHPMPKNIPDGVQCLSL